MAENQTTVDPFAEFSAEPLVAKQPDPFAEFSEEPVTAELDGFEEFSAEPSRVGSPEDQAFNQQADTAPLVRSSDPTSLGDRSKFEQPSSGSPEDVIRRQAMMDDTIKKKNSENLMQVIRAPLLGLNRAVLEIHENIADFIPMPDGLEEVIREGVAGVREKLPTPEEQNVVAGVVSTLAQFGIPFAAVAGKIGTSANLVKRFFGAAAAGAAVDVAVFDEDEARLSTWLTKLDNPILNNAVTQFMVNKEDDPAIMNKIRQLAEGAVLGVTADAFIGILQSVKAGKIFANFKKLGGEKPVDPLSDEAMSGLESAVGQKFNITQMDIDKLEAVEGFKTGAQVETISQMADDIQTGVRVPSILVEVDADGNPVRLLSGADDIKASQMLSSRFDGNLTKLKVKTIPSGSVESIKLNAALVEQTNQASRDAKAKLHENFAVRMKRWTGGDKWVDLSGDIKKSLLKSGGTEGKVAVEMHVLAGGSTPKAHHAFQTYKRDVYKGLKVQDELMLDDIINSRRVVEIDKRKAGKYTFPGGRTGAEHSDNLKNLEMTLGPEKWAEMSSRADRFFDGMKDQLLDLRNNKIIDETLYQKLKDFDYSPVQYLDIIDPIRSIDIGGKKVSVRDSGIALLEHGKDAPVELSSRDLLAQVVGRTQNRIARNNANLALRDVGINHPDNGVVEVPKAVLNPPEKQFKTVPTKVRREVPFKREVKKTLTRDEALRKAYEKSKAARDSDETFDEWLDGIGGAEGGEARTFITLNRESVVEESGVEDVFEVINEQIEIPAKKVDLSKTKTPKGFSRVSVMVDGEPQSLFIETSLAGQWVTQDPQISGGMAEVLRWASLSPIVRALATGHNPGFAFTNFPRDIMHIFMTTQEYSRFPPIAMYQMAGDLKATRRDAFRKQGSYVDYIEEGGGMNFLTHQGKDVFVTAPDSVRQQLDPQFAKLKAVTSYAGETSELWTRLALRRRSLKNIAKTENPLHPGFKENIERDALGNTPGQQATFKARNYFDFSQGGAYAKAADHQIPYLNATIQAARGGFRSAKEDPAGFAIKTGWLMGASGGLYVANYMNFPEAMNAIPDKEMQDYWVFPTGGKTVDKNGNIRHSYYRVKKDDLMKPLLWPVDASMTWFFKGRAPDEGLIDTITETIPLMKGNIPLPSIAAYATYVGNYDFWFDDDVWGGKTLPWPLSKEEFKGEGQGRPTPKEWVAFGEATGLSPERSKRAWSQVIPNNPFLDLAVAGGRIGSAMFGGDPLLSEDTLEQTPGEFLSSSMITRRFYHLTHPAETELTRTEEITDQALAKRLQVRRQYAQQYNEFRRGRQSLGDVAKWIAGQPEEFRSGLEKQHERGLGIDIALAPFRGVEGIPSSISWLQWMNEPPDVRAELFYKEFVGRNAAKRDQMRKLGERIPGFWTEDFGRFLSKMLNSRGREQH